MGDVGDYWRENKKYRERQKRKMIRCAGCDRLEFPLSPCMRCGTITDKNGHAVDPKKAEHD